MPKRVKKEKSTQIIDQSLPMTGKAVKKGRDYLVKWANGESQRLSGSMIKEKDGILWVENAKKAYLLGQIDRTRIMIKKGKRDLKRNPKDTIRRFSVYGWRKYLSTLKRALDKVDRQEKVHNFIKDRVCQKV